MQQNLEKLSLSKLCASYERYVRQSRGLETLLALEYRGILFEDADKIAIMKAKADAEISADQIISIARAHNLVLGTDTVRPKVGPIDDSFGMRDIYEKYFRQFLDNSAKKYELALASDVVDKIGTRSRSLRRNIRSSRYSKKHPGTHMLVMDLRDDIRFACAQLGIYIPTFFKQMRDKRLVAAQPKTPSDTKTKLLNHIYNEAVALGDIPLYESIELYRDRKNNLDDKIKFFESLTGMPIGVWLETQAQQK